MSVLLGEKEKILVEKKIQLGNFQNKINDLNSNLNSLEKEKKQIEYKIMMKSHSIKEKSNLSYKRIGLILTAFTVIAIIIAILLILNKNK